MLLALRSLWEPTTTPTLPNQPGRVYKGQYPYWQQRKKPYWEKDGDPDEDEFMVLMGIDL